MLLYTCLFQQMYLTHSQLFTITHWQTHQVITTLSFNHEIPTLYNWYMYIVHLSSHLSITNIHHCQTIYSKILLHIISKPTYITHQNGKLAPTAHKYISGLMASELYESYWEQLNTAVKEIVAELQINLFDMCSKGCRVKTAKVKIKKISRYNS